MAKFDQACEGLFNKATEAGKAAAAACVPTPMVVSGGGKQYFVEDGVCGFAGVIVRPGNCSFANYLKKAGLGRKDYYGGVRYSIHDYNQSLAKKEAFAYAFAGVLNRSGIDARVDSRMD
jgi:hypothetical protein